MLIKRSAKEWPTLPIVSFLNSDDPGPSVWLCLPTLYTLLGMLNAVSCSSDSKDNRTLVDKFYQSSNRNDSSHVILTFVNMHSPVRGPVRFRRNSGMVLGAAVARLPPRLLNLFIGILELWFFSCVTGLPSH